MSSNFVFLLTLIYLFIPRVNSQKAAADGPFDYVIVGGGTAGLTLASRLAEDPKVSVIVIEAGGDTSNELTVKAPGLAVGQFENPRFDWAFRTTPQEDMNGRVLAWPRGRQLGGSSAINFMQSTYASQQDINNWGELGNTGWSWKELEPYFDKSETYVAPSQQVAEDLGAEYIQPDLYGKAGPVQKSFVQSYSDFVTLWPESYKNLGFSLTSDPRGGVGLGGYNAVVSIDPKVRERSYAVAYLKIATGRQNLKIITDALVSKVTLIRDRNSLRASGVEYTKNGSSYNIEARRDVVLCAGAVQSPQILELSGIGGKAVLEKQGIEVLVDNPNVGENLQDHVMFVQAFEAADGVTNPLGDPAILQAAIQEYVANRTGLISGILCSHGYLSYSQILGREPRRSELVDSAAQNGGRDRIGDRYAKQYQLLIKMLLEPNEATGQTTGTIGSVNPEEAENSTTYFAAFAGNSVSLYGVLSHPFSRGSIHIQSSDPTAYPTIDPKYLSHPLDTRILGELGFHLQDLASVEPLSSLFRNGGTVPLPGFQRLTQDNVQAEVRKQLVTQYHPIGTCSMEPRNKGGVVDEKLRVYGVENLRVVDASIFPLMVRGNTQTLVYAVAEKAADMIKEEWD